MLSKITFTPAVGSAVDLHASTGSYSVSRVEGVSGPPEPRDVSRTAPGRDGSLDDTRFLQERKIVLEGEIIGSSQSDVWSKWDALAAAFQSTLLSPATLKITLPDGTTERQASVVLSGSAQPSFEGGSRYLAYQVGFRAPDPRWYGTTLNTSTVSVSGSITAESTSTNVSNAGNAPSSPTLTCGATSHTLVDLTVTVPTAYTSLSPQGSSIKFDASVTGGLGLTSSSSIDFGKRTGTSLNSVSPTTEWPVLFPGTSSWKYTSVLGTSGSRSLTLSWRDAWW